MSGGVNKPTAQQPGVDTRGQIDSEHDASYRMWYYSNGHFRNWCCDVKKEAVSAASPVLLNPVLFFFLWVSGSAQHCGSSAETHSFNVALVVNSALLFAVVCSSYLCGDCHVRGSTAFHTSPPFHPDSSTQQPGASVGSDDCHLPVVLRAFSIFYAGVNASSYLRSVLREACVWFTSVAGDLADAKWLIFKSSDLTETL